MSAGALGRARLRLGSLLPRSLPGPVAGVPAGRADLFVRLAPVLHFLLGEGAVSLECGAELDWRHFRARLRGIGTAFLLSGRAAGQQQGRHDSKNLLHSSLDIDRRAERRAGSARSTSARRLSQTSESERRSVKAVRLNAERRILRENVGGMRRGIW